MNETMNFKFMPGYYEWHLTDEKGNILHNMVDPSECLFNEDGTPMDLEDVIDFCNQDLLMADWRYYSNEDYNGVLLEENLTAGQIKAASEIMGKTLYNYYIS